MILPSDNWCEQRYFMKEFNNEGVRQKVPDYKLVFQEDIEIGQVISKIGSLMADRGFPLKDAEQEIKTVEARNEESKVIISRTSGASILESPLDKLKNRAKADIIVQVWWKVSKTDQGKVVSFIMEAFDSYTSKRIATSSGNSLPNNTDVVPVLLQNAISASFGPFATQLQGYFDDMLLNGREIVLKIKKWENWNPNFETKINGITLSEYIIQWINANSVKGKFNLSHATENDLSFESVRIPIYDPEKRALDARQFAGNLQKYLQASPFNFEVKLMTRGLGEAMLILGEK